MLALRFTQTKNFMERLLLSPTFDRFLLSEASITTAATVSIDGHFHPDFYPEADEEENAPVRADRGLIYWEQLRPTCFQLIRGKHTPLSFSFISVWTPPNPEAAGRCVPVVPTRGRPRSVSEIRYTMGH